ncbi:hypothetical protein EIF71_09205 [Campylobacter coli]|nr:hypothetical protein [Campylobacter coli]EKI3337117.1 hypothetical protein [Campylobacter coli]
MNLDFLNEFKLKNKDLNEKLEFLIPDFLVKKAITIIYANGGSGKSYLSAAISKTLCKDVRVKSIVYIDMDNPLNVLNERGFGELILNESKFTYIHRSSLKTSAYELLEMIEGKGVAGSYEGVLFVLDSLRNFADIDNDTKMMSLMSLLMNLRECGATIIALHHSTKDGRAFKGSNHIRNSSDCMYFLQKVANLEQGFEVLLSVQKERAGIKDQAFFINTKTLNIKNTDLQNAKISDKEEAFIEKVLKLLKEKSLSTSEILSALDVSRSDNFSRNTLEKFKGVFWESELGGENGRTFVWKSLKADNKDSNDKELSLFGDEL